MSNASVKPKAPPRLTAEEEETLYFRDTGSAPVLVNIDHLQVDRMCSLCGHWESEHPWDACRTPNWL
jgi:hypothetical protein